MTAEPVRSGGSFWLARILFVLSLLVSAVTAVILGFLVYLFISGYSGGHSPTSVTALAFPAALLFFVVLGIPAIVISALLWAAYGAAKSRGAGGHAGPGPAGG